MSTTRDTSLRTSYTGGAGEDCIWFFFFFTRVRANWNEFKSRQSRWLATQMTSKRVARFPWDVTCSRSRCDARGTRHSRKGSAAKKRKKKKTDLTRYLRACHVVMDGGHQTGDGDNGGDGYFFSLLIEKKKIINVAAPPERWRGEEIGRCESHFSKSRTSERNRDAIEFNLNKYFVTCNPKRFSSRSKTYLRLVLPSTRTVVALFRESSPIPYFRQSISHARDSIAPKDQHPVSSYSPCASKYKMTNNFIGVHSKITENQQRRLIYIYIFVDKNKTSVICGCISHISISQNIITQYTFSRSQKIDKNKNTLPYHYEYIYTTWICGNV